MRKILSFGLALTIAVLLTCSCNKNRFDFSQLDSVEASGQWKLPIGSARVTLNKVMGQFTQNSMVSYDADGHLQISYRYAMDTVVKGSTFMRYDDMQFPFSFELDNPTPFVLDEPVEDTLSFDQFIELDSDVMSLKAAKIRSGAFVFNISTDLGEIEEIVVTSPTVYDADGTPFEHKLSPDNEYVLDLAGARFEADQDNSLKFHYLVRYMAFDFTEPEIHFDSHIGVRQLCVQELTGSLSSYPTRFVVDEPFNLPLDNVSGELRFVDTRLSIMQRNSFELAALIRIDTAMISGGQAKPTMIFDDYPVVVDVHHSPTYSHAFDKTLNLALNTEHDSLYVSGEFILNPDGFDNVMTLYDTASLGLAAEGVIPMRFNVPSVVYMDTLDLNLSSINTPDILKEVLLNVAFDSELPFNLKAQLYTLDATTGMVTDSLFTNEHFINGSFTDASVRTETTISVTHQKLTNLMNANKLFMRFGVDTDGKDVYLDLNDALGVTLKADIIYDGDLMELTE